MLLSIETRRFRARRKANESSAEHYGLVRVRGLEVDYSIALNQSDRNFSPNRRENVLQTNQAADRSTYPYVFLHSPLDDWFLILDP